MSSKLPLNRRNFLKSAAVSGAAAFVPGSAGAATPAQNSSSAQASAPTPPREVDPGSSVEVLTTDRPGGDFMVDVIKTLDFEYVASNPGSSFRGIHESLVNYGGNRAPEFLTCLHEESSVAMAHGYFKAEGKPMAVLCHGTVGMQHAAMAIYNAYCDRVPIYILAGNHLDATHRRADAEATLPALTEACKWLISAERRNAFAERGKKLADAHAAALERVRADAAY